MMLNHYICHFVSCVHRKESEYFVRIFREPGKELRRQRISCAQVSSTKMNSQESAETRLESQVTLHEPLFLTPGSVYSLLLKSSSESCQFVWGPLKKKRMKIGNTFVNFHSEGVSSIREMHVIPDVSNTWGPRGPEL